MIDFNFHDNSVNHQDKTSNLKSINQNNIKQQRFSSRERLFLFYPLLEKWIVEEINKIKRKKRLHILISCSMAMFCLCLAQQMAFFCIKYYMYKSYNILNLTAELSTSFFTQIFASLCADFFSILPVAYFTIGLSIISLTLFGYTAIFDDRLFFLALFFSFICLKLYYVSFTYIIYDSAYSLKKRFNNAGIFSLLVLNISMIMTSIVKLFGLSYYNSQKDEERGDLYQLYLKWLLIFSSIGLLLIIISAINLQKSYGSIQRLRETSQKYKLFTIYQGIGINLKLIYKYFRNKDFIYLCILSCIGCASISPNNIFFNLQSCGKFDEFQISLLFLISCVGGIMGFFIFLHLNEQKNLVESGYLFIQKMMIVIAVNKLVEIIILLLSNQIMNDILIILYGIIYFVNGAIFYLVFVVNHQLSICLQPFRSSLKCLGIGVITTFCDFNYIIYKIINMLDPQFQWVMNLNISFLSLAVLVCIYSYRYLKNKQFTKLYLKIKEQHYKDVGFTLQQRSETF
ncbi:hypothetical protein ABPG74_001774 [Tetrahymena malaccensis]